MRCRSCMTVNPAGNRFCENCGSHLQLTCAQCGHDVSLLARYCGTCGGALAAASAISGLPDGAAKWGELKQATVLFADIVGSTDMVAHMDADEAMARLRPAVLRMRHSVERFGGTVVRTLGDGVMALFGVPIALEGHALLACQAALHMQNAFRQGGEGLSIRVGLHSGEVASDPEDADDGRGGGAHGVTIHLASRVIALAQPGGVCLTHACRTLAGPGCETESIGPHRLKGIPEPVEILTLQKVRAQGRGGAWSGLAQPTFRGRDAELARLRRALEQTGTVNAVGVAGEPGAGKSRLCQEFVGWCRDQRLPVYEVRAQLYGHALPLQPVLELFRVHFFGITASDDAAAARARIADAFESLSPRPSDFDLLHEFFGVATVAPDSPVVGSRARHERLVALLGSLVRAAGAQKRVILIEDLQWIDEASEEFISALLRAVAGTGTLLLLNYRLSYRAPWLRVPHFELIELGELPAPDMDALVSELLEGVSSTPEVARLVCQRSGGNPFFAEELVRTLAESALLSGENGLPAGGIEDVERALPVTLQAVIGARLDRIGEPEKTLLQMCAIIGKEIPLAVLEHVASPLAQQIGRGLDGLCEAGLILPQADGGGRRFAFRHPLIQEVAYSTQLRVRRGQVHASVGAAMELYYRDELDEYAALIGYHFEQAGDRLQAARYHAKAADWIGGTNAAQAIRHWRKVRQLLERAGRGSEVDKLRATAGGKIALLGWREGVTFDEVKPLIDEALGIATAGDDRLIPWLLTIEGRMLVASGGPADGYVDLVKKALLYIDVDRDPGRVALAHAFLSQAYAWAGLLHEALAANDVALRDITHIDAYDREFIGFSIDQWVLGVRARILIRMGRLDDARHCLVHMLDVEALSSQHPVPGMSRLGFIELAWASDDVAMARQHGEQLQLLAAKQGAAPYVLAFMHGYRGLALALAGDHQSATACFREGLSLIRRTGAAREYESELLAGMAECALRLGEHEEAHAHATVAIELSRARTTRVAHCRALITRAEAVLAQSGDPAEAHADFEAAESLIRETGAVGWGPALERARAALTRERAA